MGSFFNERQGHTIHKFFPGGPPGYKIVEVPSPVIYLPIAVEAIDHLQLQLVDQNGQLVNLRGEDITITIHIKS